MCSDLELITSLYLLFIYMILVCVRGNVPQEVKKEVLDSLELYLQTSVNCQM